MRHWVALGLAVTVALASGAAGAVTVKNLDGKKRVMLVKVPGKKQAIKLQPNETYDSQGKDAMLRYNKVQFDAKGDEEYIIQNNELKKLPPKEEPKGDKDGTVEKGNEPKPEAKKAAPAKNTGKKY